MLGLSGSPGGCTMNHRHNRFRRPDPFVILAIIVGIGVILTTTAQAAPGSEPPPMPEGATPVQAWPGAVPLQDRMDYRPGQPFLTRFLDRQVNLVSDRRGRGPSIDLEFDSSRESEMLRYGLAGARSGGMVRLSVSKRF